METKQKRKSISEQIAIVERIIGLMAENQNKRQITKLLKNEMHPTQVSRYYQRALEYLRTTNSVNTADVRNMKIAGLERDLKEAYDNYKLSKSARWFELYIAIKAQLDLYYPNGLKPETEAQSLNIQIKYEEA